MKHAVGIHLFLFFVVSFVPLQAQSNESSDSLTQEESEADYEYDIWFEMFPDIWIILRPIPADPEPWSQPEEFHIVPPPPELPVPDQQEPDEFPWSEPGDFELDGTIVV